MLRSSRMASIGSRTATLVTATLLSAGLLTATSLTGCSRQTGSADQSPKAPVVTEVKTLEVASPSEAALRLAAHKLNRQSKLMEPADGRPLAEQLTPPTAQPAISAEVTLTKASIFDRLFLYGTDLQYSSLNDGGMMLQSLTVAHTPARFTIVGDRLQLTADQTHLFESDVNHPGRLINEFPIVRQDAQTVTVTIRTASPIVTTLLGGARAGAPRTNWVRSVEFVEKGDYLLMETSIESADGSVFELMESVFPRETLVSKVDQAPLLADGDAEPLAKRYRFLSGEPVYLDLEEGRTQTLVASRYPITAQAGVIEWYVTPNVPAEYMPMIKAGVEGWNRYSRKMWNRDFVRFNGVVPAGVKLGDPRFNIINWDSVPEAGAAYESQAYDPTTGLQSHSLIYLPYAWVKIGIEYWKNGGLSQDEEQEKAIEAVRSIMKNGRLLDAPLHVPCLHDIANSVSLQGRRTPEVFAKELLKQVLFHEVGHALGLAHNFKASLIYNPTVPGSVFSTSIMDYNQYQIEDGAFVGDSADGVVLEYDRQVISALYSSGKDVAATDPELPACDDTEADDVEGGVDPLCLRYDAGEDPTLQLSRTVKLTIDPDFQVGRTQSLAASVLETRSLLGDATTATTQDEVTKRLARIETQLGGIAKFYYASGAQSLAYMTKANVGALRIFKDDILPSTFDPSAMRERVRLALDYSSNITKLEPASERALDQVAADTANWIKTTPWFASLSQEQQAAALAKVEKSRTEFPKKVEDVVFPKLRSSVLAALTRIETSPFFFSVTNQQTTDYERVALDLLENAASQALQNGKLRPMSERATAIAALITYKQVIEGADAISRVQTRLRAEISRARTATQREALRGLLASLES